MKIIYYDGGVLTCSYFEIDNQHIYADDVYIVDINDVERVED